MKQPVERRLAAILAADVAGYSRLMGADEEGTLDRLKAHRRELVDPKIKEHRGRIVKTTGDGMLVEFPSVVDAVRCGVEVQRAMIDRNADVPEDKRIAFRVGINLGDVIIDGDDIYGDGVNIAARLEALAEPGGICISRVVRDQIRDKLPYSFGDMGKQIVKNIARPVRAYAMSADAVDSIPATAPPAEPEPQRRRLISRSSLIATSVSAAIFIGVIGWWAWPRAISPPVSPQATAQTASVNRITPAPRLSFVVLPFTNLSSDPDQEYFADGITDDLTTDLTRIPDSFVIARNTAFTSKGKPVDIKQLGRELGVRYVIEGSVRRAGEQVQVNVQLINAETGAHIWADRFDTSRARLAEAQREITARLARTLRLELVTAEARRSEQRTAVEPEASDLVMRGWARFYRPTSATQLEQASQAFERALQIEPGSIDARIGLARTLVMRVNSGFSSSAPQDLARAEQLLLEAIEGDPNRSIVHEALGFLQLNQKDRLHEAQIELETAVALDPNNLNAILLLGWNSINLGEPYACLAHGEKALRLSPRDPAIWGIYAQLGVCHLALNHVDLAIDYLNKSLAENSRLWWVHYYLASAMGLKGDFDGARTELAQSLKLKPEINSISQFYLLKPWYNDPKLHAIDDKTLNEGLRRIGFPDN